MSIFDLKAVKAIIIIGAFELVSLFCCLFLIRVRVEKEASQKYEEWKCSQISIYTQLHVDYIILILPWTTWNSALQSPNVVEP